jgi:hypothetical protein
MRNGGITGLRVDITELKTAQAALQRSEERLSGSIGRSAWRRWEAICATCAPAQGSERGPTKAIGSSG